MSRKIDDADAHRLNPGESAKAVGVELESAFRHKQAVRAELLRRLEAVARCGALFSDDLSARWGAA